MQLRARNGGLRGRGNVGFGSLEVESRVDGAQEHRHRCRRKRDEAGRVVRGYVREGPFGRGGSQKGQPHESAGIQDANERGKPGTYILITMLRDRQGLRAGNGRVTGRTEYTSSEITISNTLNGRYPAYPAQKRGQIGEVGWDRDKLDRRRLLIDGDDDDATLGPSVLGMRSGHGVFCKYGKIKNLLLRRRR